MFKSLESAPQGQRVPAAELLKHIPFDKQGLIAAIAQQHDSGEVLMLGWMNHEALRLTLETGQVTYFSRSRQTLWRKGESSGQTQQLVHLSLDCDGDAVLLAVNQTGPACHTGRRSCFYWRREEEDFVLQTTALIDPKDLYPR